jgi:peptide/nickel transport system substrate-binding protein
MSVWTATPKLSAGFMRFGGPMNRFGTGDLCKNANHVLFHFDYPGAFRQTRYDLDFVERNKIRTSEKGKLRADWDELIAKRTTLVAGRKKIAAGEPNANWRREMTREPSFDAQFEAVWQNWQKAANDKDRQMWWRTAAELVLSESFSQMEYAARSPNNKAMNRLSLDLMQMPWEKAIGQAYKSIQMFQDTYYMVPLYEDKIQYLQNPKLTGVGIYKFAWGPMVFNFKYMNLAD